MQTRFFLTCIIFITLFASAQDKTVQIQVKNSPSSEYYLADFYGDKNSIIDTAKTDTTGMAIFKLSEANAPGMYRVYVNQQVFFDIIYNREDISIISDFDNIYESLEVVLSTENKIYYDYLRTRHEFMRKFELLSPINDFYPRNDTFFHVARGQYIGIQAEIQVYINDVIELYPDSWTSKIMKAQRPLYYDPSMDEPARRLYTIEHYFDNFDFNDIELIKSNIYTTAAIQYMSLYSNPGFTQEQLESEFIKAVDKIMYEAMDNNLVYEFIVKYLVGGFEQYHFDKVLDYIAENYTPDQCENEERKSDLQTRLEKYAELSIGKPAPEIVINDNTGEEVKLSKIRSDYTLIIFWASWCPHCNEMLPQIQNIYQSSINDRQMSILAISLDNNKEEWETALQGNQYTWTNASELKGWESQSAIDYNIYATPSMYLLDKHKNIVAKPITMEELKQALFKENILK